MSLQSILLEFEDILANVPARLRDISETLFSAKPYPEEWSKKQILGHLIDSAVNNHQRFIRIQYEPNTRIVYDQDKWNELSHYQNASLSDLTTLWTSYNRHLLHILQNISPEDLNKTGLNGDNMPRSLSWYISDYITHMKHHLHQILAD